MAQNYEDIVRKCYVQEREKFLRIMGQRYPKIRLEDAENLYQDTFLAIYENLQLGRIDENKSWSNYILTIGLRLAAKHWGKCSREDSMDEGFETEDGDSAFVTAFKVAELIKALPEEEQPLYKNPEVQAILGNELTLTPYPCGKLIKMYYANANMSMDDIAEEFGYKNATTAKAKKSQCMTGLIKRVTSALKFAGFDVEPKKRNRNGKN